MSREVRVKKVSAYPIPIQLGDTPGDIVKLAMTGFLVETEKPLKVHQAYEGTFKLPVLNYTIQFHGIVVKTYDRFQADGTASRKLAEITFKSLPPGFQEHIREFLIKTGQGK